MVSIIWGLLIVIGIVYSLVNGNLNFVNNEILASSAQSLEMFLSLFPIIVLWMGLMKIAEDSGLLTKLSYKFSFILSKLFPSIPKGHESLGLIASNIIINMLGLGSAATPFGLKAMEKPIQDYDVLRHILCTEERRRSQVQLWQADRCSRSLFTCGSIPVLMIPYT